MSRSITTFDPMREVAEMSNWMDRFFGSPLLRDMQGNRLTQMSVPLDVYENEGKLWIKAAIPGVNAEDLDITVQDGVLTIRGETKQDEVNETGRVYRREYSYGSFTRSVRLPENVDVNNIDAEFDKGFVYIALPTIEEPKPQAVKVPVRSRSANPDGKAQKN